MAWIFADSFDAYQGWIATMPSTYNYWDQVPSASYGNFGILAGRFGGWCVSAQFGSFNPLLVKNSGFNHSYHHISCAFQNEFWDFTAPSVGLFIQLLDDTTAQCAIAFMSNGDISLIRGAADISSPTIISTWPRARKRQQSWDQFEFEVVVHNTAGSFAGRKNGNIANDFSQTGLDTSSNANNYANTVRIGMYGAMRKELLDEFLWRSDTTAPPWLGEVRPFQRHPIANISTQFAVNPTSMSSRYDNVTGNAGSLSGNVVRMTSVPVLTSGIVTSLQFNFAAGITGNARMALYESPVYPSSLAGNLLVQTSQLTNPGSGINTFPIPGGYPLVQTSTYMRVMVALWSDVAIIGNGSAGTSQTFLLPATYGSTFPSNGSAGTYAAYGTEVGSGQQTLVMTPYNYAVVSLLSSGSNDDQTAYVYDPTAGHADMYSVSAAIDPIWFDRPTPSQLPSYTFGTLTRATMQKTDPGTRNAALRLKSGATTVSTPTVILPGGDQWGTAWRFDLVDPSTGAAWTNTNLTAAQIGPIVVS